MVENGLVEDKDIRETGNCQVQQPPKHGHDHEQRRDLSDEVVSAQQRSGGVERSVEEHRSVTVHVATGDRLSEDLVQQNRGIQSPWSGFLGHEINNGGVAGGEPQPFDDGFWDLRR
ncbi:hypothetical protein WICPIJ_009772 [Wickerhamomyces pijperi]|uniref:Uncharacterized protein n=1 Tax=Wickerhamomyces pijperi TaxID=599730 RepID=A0A9P8TCP8_WICPI|nr:hypothetical protein WICPIJ_009772 [Wickerhamomyces pijperi]